MDVSHPNVPSAADALALRYGTEASPAAGPWNEHIGLLLSHRSIRFYRADALPLGTLETLVAAAQSAATSSNLQTWSVIAVTDPAKKAALAKVAANQKHILVLLPGEQVSDRITLFHEASARNHRTLPANLVPENHLWELSE